jgi:hypothetical protein
MGLSALNADRAYGSDRNKMQATPEFFEAPTRINSFAQQE